MIKERIRSTLEGAEDSTIPFIDFIVCPAYKVGFKFDVLQQYGLKHSDYIRNGKFSPQANKSESIDLQKVVCKLLKTVFILIDLNLLRICK